MHLNLDNSITGAGFAAAALYVKAEPSFFVTLGFCIRCRCEQIPDHIKYTGVGSRIGPWRSSDGGLIDTDYLVKLLHTFNSAVFARNGSCPVQGLRQRLIKNLIDQ